MDIFFILWLVSFLVFIIGCIFWGIFLIKKDINKMLKWNVVLCVGCLLMNLFGNYIK